MKIYLSGTRNWYSYFARWIDKWGPIPLDAPQMVRCFPSYWYEKKNPHEILTSMPGDDVILDSGAHTLFSSYGLSVWAGKINKEEMPDLDDYIRGYLRFLKKNWERIDYYVELDVAELVGMDKVRAMRQDFMAAGLWAKCITAWHPPNGLKDFDWMLDHAESRFVAMEGIRPDRDPLPFNWFIKKCYDQRIRIHVFASMADKFLRAYPFYSVDCASWLNPAMYGVRMYWNGQQIKSQATQRGTGSFHALKPVAARLKEAIEGYRQAEQFYTAYWKAKGIDWDAQVQHETRDHRSSPQQAEARSLELQAVSHAGATGEVETVD